ncbi:rCG23096 [Rattus norvegicus]|uniref:RCG23096 n=1 Tax=Rattus norvegicus TaxID=10116 RepID=A6KNA4_RAT|nr:rCG23096 [Rattus norvegicus]
MSQLLRGTYMRTNN